MSMHARSTSPEWASVVLEHASPDADRSSGFWRRVTGYQPGPALDGTRTRGSSLRPPDGDPYLATESAGAPGSRLELEVAGPGEAIAEATAAGAAVAAEIDRREPVLRSPGGLRFRYVAQRNARRPSAVRWSDGRRSQVDQVTLDVPPDRYEEELAFWTALTGWELTPSTVPGFARLQSPPSQPLRWLVQRLDDPGGDVSAHLDLACDDREAEVARHVSLGAVAEGSYDWWTVLADPAGRRYCVTRRPPWDGPAA